ncbi:MAG: C45 family autoproteolytic acyltransferase/hydrolase [Candidatus Bipolaricaulota bacterium]
MEKGELEKVKISGSPLERGKEYGRKLKGRIDEFVAYLLGEFGKQEGSDVDLLTHSEKYIPFIKDYSKEIYDELRGTAEGSGRELEEIVMIALHEERRSFSELSQGCTAFAVTGGGTKDGSNLMGQTWDITPELCQNADPFLLQVNREAGPNFLSYTYPGMMAGAGLN